MWFAVFSFSVKCFYFVAKCTLSCYWRHLNEKGTCCYLLKTSMRAVVNTGLTEQTERGHSLSPDGRLELKGKRSQGRGGVRRQEWGNPTLAPADRGQEVRLFAYKFTLSNATCAARGERVKGAGGDLQTTDSALSGGHYMPDDIHRPWLWGQGDKEEPFMSSPGVPLIRRGSDAVTSWMKSTFNVTYSQRVSKTCSALPQSFSCLA